MYSIRVNTGALEASSQLTTGLMDESKTSYSYDHTNLGENILGLLGADPVIVRGRSLSGPATDSWNTPPKTCKSIRGSSVLYNDQLARFDTPVVLVGKPAGLIISVTLDCAAAQWIPTRFCECYGRDKRGARLTSLDPGLAKVETACPQGGETCPYYTAQQPFEPDDNTYAIPQSQGSWS